MEDGSRHVLGVSEPLAKEQRVASLIADRVSPKLVPDVELLRHRDRLVLAVRVHPSGRRPHYLGNAPETGAYVRVGSTNRQADTDLIAEMQRFALGQSFDEQPVPELESEAIDFRAASESFAGFRKLTERDLDVLGLCTTHQDRRVPSVGGLLLFGRDRLARFPDAWIQAGTVRRYGQGADPGSGRAQDAASRKPSPRRWRSSRTHLAAGIDIGHVRAQPRWSLPPMAIREALVNAVAHADYSQRGAPLRVSIFDDRLEMENPGLLPFGLTLEDLPRGVSKLRNRVIGRVFHELRLVEQWGSGVQRILSACRDMGLPVPVWEEIGNRLRVTMRRGVNVASSVREGTGGYITGTGSLREAASVQPTDQAILTALVSPDGLGTRQIAEAIGLSTRATRTRLKGLVDRGLVVEIGHGPHDPGRRYHRARP